MTQSSDRQTLRKARYYGSTTDSAARAGRAVYADSAGRAPAVFSSLGGDRLLFSRPSHRIDTTRIYYDTLHHWIYLPGYLFVDSSSLLVLATNTSDGHDNKSWTICNGPATPAATRGAWIFGQGADIGGDLMASTGIAGDMFLYSSDHVRLFGNQVDYHLGTPDSLYPRLSIDDNGGIGNVCIRGNRDYNGTSVMHILNGYQVSENLHGIELNYDGGESWVVFRDLIEAQGVMVHVRPTSTNPYAVAVWDSANDTIKSFRVDSLRVHYADSTGKIPISNTMSSFSVSASGSIEFFTDANGHNIYLTSNGNVYIIGDTVSFENSGPIKYSTSLLPTATNPDSTSFTWAGLENNYLKKTTRKPILGYVLDNTHDTLIVTVNNSGNQFKFLPVPDAASSQQLADSCAKKVSLHGDTVFFPNGWGQVSTASYLYHIKDSSGVWVEIGDSLKFVP